MSDIATNNDPTATSPGAILKRCREYHDISLEEAAESTKIGENYLKALEDEQLKDFASLAYLKGFLRIYATYLGLNPDDMIRLYEKLYGAGRQGSDRSESSRSSIDSPPRKKFPLQKLIMPAVFLVLILITSIIINRSSTTQPPAVKPTPPVTAVPVPATAVQQQRSSVSKPLVVQKSVEEASEQQRSETPPVATGTQKQGGTVSRGFIVRMKVTQSGTLTVTIDGSTSQGYDLVVGDSIEWKADRSITLELSNAGGVEAELNGRTLKPFGPAGKPAVVVLDSEGVRP